MIANWLTDSTGIAGVANGSTWCNLQKIALTDEHGEFDFAAVNSELNTSDEGTRIGHTPFGVATQTHEMTYRIYAFKPGYIPSGKEEEINYATEGYWVTWAWVPPGDLSAQIR